MVRCKRFDRFWTTSTSVGWFRTTDHVLSAWNARKHKVEKMGWTI